MSKFRIMIFLFLLTGCATAGPSESVYRETQAEIERAYTRGEIDREEYLRRRKQLEHSDTEEAETLLEMWWGKDE